MDGVPTLRDISELTPYVTLARRPDLSGADDNGHRRLDSIEDTMQFKLFNRTEEVGRWDLHAVFAAPEQNVVFGLGVELLSTDRILDQ
jgi:hypothetical protein